MIPGLALLATLVFIAVASTVGVKLLLVARRTHGIGELTLGLGLFLIVGVGYPLLLAAYALGQGAMSGGVRLLLTAGTLTMSVGWCCVWIFTWRVFRPNVRLAAIAAFCGISALGVVLLLRLVGIWGIWQAPDFAEVVAPRIGTLGTPVIAMLSYVWTSSEAFRYWGMMRKRMALGLADAVVTNRFFLWGLVGVFSAVSLVPTVIAYVRGVSGLDSWTQLCGALSGLACSVTLFLAFLPPRAYLNWCRQAA
jgi:hypothetical protein